VNELREERFAHGHPMEDFIPSWSCGAYRYTGVLPPFPGSKVTEPMPIGREWIRREDCPEHR
jgi:hypothetical protein